MKKLLLLSFFAIMTFASAFAQAQDIIITEIYYNSPGDDSLEFIEIYNRGAAAVNMKDFTFRTAINDTFPDVTLGAGKFYVVALSANFVKKSFNIDVRKWKQGQLNNGAAGELIELYNNNNTLVDSVRYKSVAPWPTSASGQGPGLSLCDFTKDNGNAANWSASTTPTGFKMKVANGTELEIFASLLKENCTVPTVKPDVKDATITAQKNANAPFNIQTANGLSLAPSSWGIAAVPVNGTVTVSTTAPSITFVPKVDFCGSENVKYYACNGALCDTATLKVTYICPANYQKLDIGKITGDADANSVPDSLNVFGEIEGIVHCVNYATSPATLFTMIDAANKENGVSVSRFKNFGYTAKEGDKIKVRGLLTQFSGLTTFSPDTIILVSGGNTLFAPTVLTKLDEVSENMLVQIKGLTLVDKTKWTTGVGASGFTVQATDGTTTFAIRVDKDFSEVYNLTAPPAKFDLIGIGSQFDSSLPYTADYQIIPRKASDIKNLVATNDLLLGEAVKMFPNPFNTQIEVQLSETMDALSISNILGEKIFYTTQVAGNQVIETNDWASGIYFVSIEKAGKQFTSKLIKQ